MINYAIPGMYELHEAIFYFLDFKKENPNYFYDNINIEICYGNPQFCIWDGGRIFQEYYQASKEKISEIIHIYNNVFNIPIRYVFTNTCLEEKHYYDRFGNLLMELGSDGPNEVVLNDENFLQFLKQQYPTYKFVSSTTKCLLNKTEVKKELNKDYFKLVCLDYNLNSNLDFLKTFSKNEIEKTEFLVNPICGLGCPFRKNHYYLNSQSHLKYGKPYNMEGCKINHGQLHPETIKNNYLTYNALTNIYAPLGFQHFKIEGRTWEPVSLYLMLLNYMIKPEYKDEALHILLTKFI